MNDGKIACSLEKELVDFKPERFVDSPYSILNSKNVQKLFCMALRLKLFVCLNNCLTAHQHCETICVIHDYDTKS